MQKKHEEAILIQEFIQKQLGKIRKKRSYTQEQIANKAGIAPKTLSDIETNRRGLSLKTLIKICKALNINIKQPFF